MHWRKGSAILVAAAVAVAGESAWTQFETARQLLGSGQHERAEALFRACLANDANVEDAHYYLGVLLERKGDVKGAAAEYAQVTDKVPTYAFAQSRLGALALRSSDAKGAAESFQKAADAAPNLDSLLQLASARMDLKQWKQAEEALTKADFYSPKDLSLLESWSRLYVETGRFALALERLDALVAQSPKDARLRLMKAVCLDKLGKPEPALRELEAGLKVDPANEEILKRLIAAYEGVPGKASERDLLSKRLEWLRKNPTKVRTAPPAKPAEGAK